MRETPVPSTDTTKELRTHALGPASAAREDRAVVPRTPPAFVVGWVPPAAGPVPVVAPAGVVVVVVVVVGVNPAGTAPVFVMFFTMLLTTLLFTTLLTTLFTTLFMTTLFTTLFTTLLFTTLLITLLMTLTTLLLITTTLLLLMMTTLLLMSMLTFTWTLTNVHTSRSPGLTIAVTLCVEGDDVLSLSLQPRNTSGKSLSGVSAIVCAPA